MIRLKVVRKDRYLYDLVDIKGKQYQKNIEFYDIEKDAIQPGDWIIFNDNTLFDPKNTEGYRLPLSYGHLAGVYGREITSMDHPDLIKIDQGDKVIYLKRFYG